LAMFGDKWTSVNKWMVSERLKAKRGWSGNGNGTDKYRFSALPGGLRDDGGGFSDAGYFGYWWTSTETDSGSGKAIYKRVDYLPYTYVSDGADNAIGISVRCVADKPPRPSAR